MTPEDYRQRYLEPLQSLLGPVSPGDWQASLLDPDYYYRPDVERVPGLDELNRTDLLELLRQILTTEYPQRHLSRNTVREFLENIRQIKYEREWQHTEIGRLEKILAQRQFDNEQIMAKLHEHQTELHQRVADLERYQCEIAVLVNETNVLRANLADLRASTSWKVTRPLRCIGWMLKAILNRQKIDFSQF